MRWITPASLALFPGDAAEGYDFNALLCLAMIEHLREKPDISAQHAQLAAETLLARIAEMDGGGAERRLSLLRKDGIDLVVLHHGSCLLDQATRICLTLDINRLVDEVKVHLRAMME